ncbi:hypothetical protein TNIN_171551 [Trichonephila inaurata madagascariensis]|uniref:Uncharacterized protein n=1 Tax=Trichonephila inaurata madagascariensis TaxID=2747483 RepID=A0A8X6WVM3_9ARAC|nr:hypothetical protein TNIN_171551 [Trichonephila inaurata madagascariensis]
MSNFSFLKRKGEGQVPEPTVAIGKEPLTPILKWRKDYIYKPSRTKQNKATRKGERESTNVGMSLAYRRLYWRFILVIFRVQFAA